SEDSIAASHNQMVRGLNGEILSYNDTGIVAPGTWVPLHDRLGSTIAMVNSSGGATTTFTYEPYGVSSASAVNTIPFLFAGMKLTPDPGLSHPQGRYYTPRLQRFISEDPAGKGRNGDTNLFTYAGNSPTNFVDPSGRAYDLPPGVQAAGVSEYVPYLQI